jgi:VWFA-related protein
MRGRRHTRVVAALAAAALLALRPDVRARQEPQFRTVVDVVTVDVFAHRDRQPLEGLAAQDFEVRDNGVVQQIDAVGTTDSAHVIVGLDLSGSVDGEVLGQLRAAVRLVTRQLTPDDRLSIFTFADRLRVLLRAAPPDDRVDRLLDDVRVGGSTTLHDALVLGSTLSLADERPAVLLLFTDGEDTASWTTTGRALDVLRRTNVVVYTVGAGLPGALLASSATLYMQHPARVYPTAGDTLFLLDQAARTTGGEFLRVGREDRLTETFARILAQYRRRYLLSFTPAGVASGGWHRLDVRLRGRKGTAVAREGYVSRSQ